MIPEECIRNLQSLLFKHSNSIATNVNDLSIDLLASAIADPVSCIKYLNTPDKITVLNALLKVLENSYSSPKDPFHSATIQHCVEGVSNLLSNNFDASWFLPAPSDFNLSMQSHGEDFLALQLSQWADYIVRFEEQEDPEEDKEPSILDRSKYLFITWDLSRINAWRIHLLMRLSKMLIPLAERTVKKNTRRKRNDRFNVNPLLTHRLLYINWKQLRLSKESQRQFFIHIWLPYFEPWTSRDNVYYIAFIDDTLLKEKSKQLNITHEEIDHVKDVALFSFDTKIREAANSSILPSRKDPLASRKDYAVLQYSKRLCQDFGDEGSFFALFLLQGTAASLEALESADEEIRLRQNKIRNTIVKMSSIPTLVKNKSMLEKSKQYFKDITDNDKRILKDTYWKHKNNKTFEKKLNDLSENGISFKPLQLIVKNWEI